MSASKKHPARPESFGLSLAKLTLLALGFLVGIVVVGVLGYEFYLDELYPPPPAVLRDDLEGPVAAQAQRVVIVIVDSVREDLMTNPQVMPEVARIAKQGRRGISLTQPVTMTLLSVLNLGTGRTPGIAWSVHNFQADTFPDESIFYWAHLKGMKVAFTGDAAWSQLFGKWANFDDSYQDGGMYDEVENLLARKDFNALVNARELLPSPDYQIVVVHLISTDHIAHKDGALTYVGNTKELSTYAKTAEVLDKEIGELFDRYERPGDLWLIAADHGCTDSGNHGGGDEIARRAPFVVTGAGIRSGTENVEMPMNAWAPTLAVALGLPIPRTAEVPASFELLTLNEAEKLAALDEHAARRREFIAGIAETLGAEDQFAIDDATLSNLQASQPEEALTLSNVFIGQLREHRRWLHVLGVSLGIALHFFALILLLRTRSWRDPESELLPWSLLLTTAGGWLLLVTVPLIFDHWLYSLVETLGNSTESYWKFGRACLYLGLFVGLGFVLRSLLRRLAPNHQQVALGAAVWVSFVAFVVATSQIVVKWPFGPLAETYFVLFILLAAASVVPAFVNRHRGPWALAALSIAAMIGLFIFTHDENLQLLPETGLSKTAGLVAVGLVVSLLLGKVASRETNALSRVLVGVSEVFLLGGVFVYRLWPTPEAAKVALLLLLVGSVALLLRPSLSTQSRRDHLFAVALALTHVMSSDWIALMTVPTLGLVAALSAVKLPERGWTPALIAATLGLLDIAYFYICGYRFSFTAMDVRVTFMLDQTSISMVQGFFLWILQFSGMWIILWAAAISNRLQAKDPRGVRAVFVAVIALFLVRAWGPFFAIDYQLVNHWFISHAVPMFIMTTIAFALATFWFVMTNMMFRSHLTEATEARHQSDSAARRG